MCVIRTFLDNIYHYQLCEDLSVNIYDDNFDIVAVIIPDKAFTPEQLNAVVKTYVEGYEKGFALGEIVGEETALGNVRKALKIPS